MLFKVNFCTTLVTKSISRKGLLTTSFRLQPPSRKCPATFVSFVFPRISTNFRLELICDGLVSLSGENKVSASMTQHQSCRDRDCSEVTKGAQTTHIAPVCCYFKKQLLPGINHFHNPLRQSIVTQ